VITPKGLENQTLAWQNPHAVNVEPVLPANAPIMHALSLPDVYAISNVAELGEQQFLSSLQKGLDTGLSLLQVREPSLGQDPLTDLTEKVMAICSPYDCKVLLNGSVAQATAMGTHGVHLNRHRLMTLSETCIGLLRHVTDITNT